MVLVSSGNTHMSNVHQKTNTITLCFQVIFCTRRLLELSPDCDLYKVLRAESLALMKKYSEAEVEAK